MHKADHERQIQEIMLLYKEKYLEKLSEKENVQRKNIYGIVQYAKKLTAEIQDYTFKVESSEQIVKDLEKSGNESVENLAGMLVKYKRQIRATEGEIVKLGELGKVKDAEIQDLQCEIEQLHEQREDNKIKNGQIFQRAMHDNEQNQAIIKRQDKLLVDLHQKNELCQITIADNEERVQQQQREINRLDMTLRETIDKRLAVAKQVDHMRDQINTFRTHKLVEMRQTRDMENCQQCAAEQQQTRSRGGSKKGNAKSSTKTTSDKRSQQPS